MHSLQSAAVQYTNYGTGGAFELPTQSGTLLLLLTILSKDRVVQKDKPVGILPTSGGGSS